MEVYKHLTLGHVTQNTNRPIRRWCTSGRNVSSAIILHKLWIIIVSVSLLLPSCKLFTTTLCSLHTWSWQHCFKYGPARFIRGDWNGMWRGVPLHSIDENDVAACMLVIIYCWHSVSWPTALFLNNFEEECCARYFHFPSEWSGNWWMYSPMMLVSFLRNGERD